jgi:mannose-6-phosphate isomerase
MEQTLTQPLLFEPLFMERIWGGRELERRFGKKLPAGKNIGESWEVVDRIEAQSVVRQGPWKGKTLHQLWCDHRSEIFGIEAGNDSRFPILAKLLDARESLSLQVHPRDGAGSKAEMWYVLAAVPGGAIRFGLKRGVERAEFEHAVCDGRALQLMHRLSVNAGDAIFVPGGRLHAISAGNLLVEIQQNSDTTFRLFDWNRVDANGEPRALQIDEALATTNFSDFEPGIVQSTSEELVRCPHFVVEKWSLDRARRASERAAFALFFCIEGGVEVNGLQLKPGEFFLVPASAAESQLKPLTARSSVLRTTLPAR